MRFFSVLLMFFGFCGLIASMRSTISQGEAVDISFGERFGIMGMAGTLFASGFVLLFAPIYNRLKNARNEVEMAFSNIDVLLQRRHDVLDNLMAIAMRYVSHESSVLTSIAAHRSNTSSASATTQMADAETQYGSKLLAVVEAYPKLKADNGFARLTEQLDKTENAIAAERKTYNVAVKDYNDRIGALPDLFLALLLGMRSRPYFKAQSSSIEAPRF